MQSSIFTGASGGGSPLNGIIHGCPVWFPAYQEEMSDGNDGIPFDVVVTIFRGQCGELHVVVVVILLTKNFSRKYSYSPPWKLKTLFMGCNPFTCATRNLADKIKSDDRITFV